MTGPYGQPPQGGIPNGVPNAAPNGTPPGMPPGAAPHGSAQYGAVPNGPTAYGPAPTGGSHFMGGRLTISWLVVLVPILYGVYMTVESIYPLFTD